MEYKIHKINIIVWKKNLKQKQELNSIKTLKTFIVQQVQIVKFRVNFELVVNKIKNFETNFPKISILFQCDLSLKN